MTRVAFVKADANDVWTGFGEVVEHLTDSKMVVLRMRDGRMAGSIGGFVWDDVTVATAKALDLEKFAIRDWSEVQPGRQYAMVNTYRQPDMGFKPSVEFVWVTGKGTADQAASYGTEDIPVFWYANDKPHRFIDKGYVLHAYASDYGVWEVGSYKNTTNYLLDVEAIRKYTGLTVTV